MSVEFTTQCMCEAVERKRGGVMAVGVDYYYH